MLARAWPSAPGQLVACILGLLCFHVSCHGSDTAVCQAGQGSTCQTGSAMVQTKAVRQRSKDAVQESRETRNAKETDAERRVGYTVRRHGAFEIRTSDTAHVLDGGRKRYIVEDPSGCSAAVIEEMVKCASPGVTVVYKGHPEKNGMCIVILESSENDLFGFLGACRDVLSDNSVVETDSPMSLIPELPDTEDQKDTDLLETDQSTTLWGLDRIDDRKSRDNDYTPPNTGKNAHVFVADTGIRTTHKDFGGRAVATLDAITSGNPKVCKSTDNNCANDRHGHGTHCAGTIGGNKYGVAKDVTLHAVKVLSDSGGGSFSYFIKALDWVEQAGHLRPAVFSASLGGRGTHQAVRQAIDDATKKGVLVVVAAGNDGRSSRPNACGYSPAFVPSAVTVGSTTSSDSRSDFSSYGNCLDIFAPGSAIKSAGHRSDTDEATKSGTSMACPHVAGAAALIFERSPTMSAKDVRDELVRAATPNLVKDAKSGSPNKLLFVGTSGGATPTPPPTPPPKPKPTSPPKPPGACNDKAKNCAKLKQKGRCSRLGVKRKCQKTCDACCMDFAKKCAKMKRRCSQPAVKEKCPLTCNVCSSSS